MSERRVAGLTGLLFGLGAVPVLHFVAVDFESKAAGPQFLAAVDDHFLQIVAAGAAGLVLSVLLVIHVVVIRRLAPSGRELVADASTAVAALAPLGVALSCASAIIAAFGARENYPYEAVRPMGAVAENLVAVLMPFISGTALLLTIIALRDGLLPRWLGLVGGFFTVALTLLGLLLPGAGILPAIVWVLIAGVGLLIARSPGGAAAGDLAGKANAGR